MAEPRDTGVRRDEGDRALVGEEGVSLDRRRGVSFEPRSATVEQVGEEPGNGVGVREPRPSAGRARPDLHPEVRARQGREGVLVSQVIAEEDHAVGADQLSEATQGRPLSVSTSDSSSTIFPRLAVTPGEDAGPASTSSTAADASVGSTRRKWNATLAGLLSTMRAGRARCDLLELSNHLGAVRPDLFGKRAREPGFELGSVGADEMDFGREPAQGGEVPERPAGDER